jgi:hypothetical protein
MGQESDRGRAWGGAIGSLIRAGGRIEGQPGRLAVDRVDSSATVKGETVLLVERSIMYEDGGWASTNSGRRNSERSHRPEAAATHGLGEG